MKFTNCLQIILDTGKANNFFHLQEKFCVMSQTKLLRVRNFGSYFQLCKQNNIHNAAVCQPLLKNFIYDINFEI